MGELSLQQAMQLFLKTSKLKNGIQTVRIEDVWEKVMGTTIAKYTDKLQIIGSTLYITTMVAPLKHQLVYQKEQIIQLINEAMQENIIKDVIIR